MGKRHTIKTMMSRDRGVESPRAHVIEGEFGLGDQVVPAVGGKSDVGGIKDGNDMILGGTNSSFRRVAWSNG
jgi:hypothetical protein